MESKNLFSDIDLSMTKNPATGDIYLIQNERAIATSFKNLLQTNFYERLFRPEIGTQLYSLLFENNTSGLTNFINDVITLTISNFEKRVKIVDINTSFENHSLFINISYQIVGFQEIYNATVFIKKTK